MRFFLSNAKNSFLSLFQHTSCILSLSFQLLFPQTSIYTTTSTTITTMYPAACTQTPAHRHTYASLWNPDRPTDPFKLSGLQNQSFDVPELHIARRSPDLEALRSWKGRSGFQKFRTRDLSWWVESVWIWIVLYYISWRRIVRTYTQTYTLYISVSIPSLVSYEPEAASPFHARLLYSPQQQQ